MKKAFFLKVVFQIYRKVHIAECPGTHHPDLTIVSYVTLKKITETVEYAFQTFSNLFFSPYPEVNTTLRVFILPFHIVGFYSTCNYLESVCVCELQFVTLYVWKFTQMLCQTYHLAALLFILCMGHTFLAFGNDFFVVVIVVVETGCFK